MARSFAGWLLGESGPTTYRMDEALQKMEEALAGDKEKTLQSIALRTAEVKHALKQYTEAMWPNEGLTQTLIQLDPPRNAEALLDYALNAHAWFEAHVLPRVNEGMRSTPEGKWIGEMENVLLDMRRTAVQNLSKHPAQKGLNLLKEARAESLRKEKASQDVYEVERELRNLSREQSEIEDAVEKLSSFPGHNTFSRLGESRKGLMRQKQELETSWLRTWKKVQPVLENLYETSEQFASMENAQLRLLQQYLASPTRARAKDIHGSGLMMMMRLAVEALEDPKLSEGQREGARKVLLEAVEKPVFTDYFWKANELEVALQGNGKEYYAHPLYEKTRNLHVRAASIGVAQEKKLEALKALREEAANAARAEQQAFREAREFFELEWGIELLVDENTVIRP